MIACTEYISFYTIVTNYNGPLAVDIVRINDATHLKVAKCRATGTIAEFDHGVLCILQMAYPRLELICRPYGCKKEV